MIDIILNPIRYLFGLSVIKLKSKLSNNIEDCNSVVKIQSDVFSVEDMYTSISEAKKEISRRWEDKELRKKVEDFFGSSMPENFKNPKSALFRFIATPNLEYQLAYDMSKIMDLGLVFMEFLNDKFCTRNNDKLHLGKMVFYHRKNGEEARIKYKKKIIDIEKSDNKSFREIKTLWGEGFIDFHQRIFYEKYGRGYRFDVSEFKKNGETAYEVYLKIFALFICNGVLFENYFINSDKDEKRFTIEVVKPAFDEIHRIFGVKPLIVPLVSCKIDGDVFWQYYPDNLINDIKAKK